MVETSKKGEHGTFKQTIASGAHIRSQHARSTVSEELKKFDTADLRKDRQNFFNAILPIDKKTLRNAYVIRVTPVIKRIAKFFFFRENHQRT